MRPSNTSQRRRQIARALMSVMARKGFDGASIADIAAEAGLTPGLIHYHFKNKLEILLEVLADLNARHRHGLERRLEAAGPDLWRRLEAFIDYHLATEQADPEILACWIMLSGEALREPRVREAYEATLLDAACLLQGVLAGETGGVPDAAVEEAAAALIAAIQGYYVLAATARELVPQGSAARSVRRMAEGLLEPRPSRPDQGSRGHRQEEEGPCAG